MFGNISTAICQWNFLLLTLVMITRTAPLLPCARAPTESNPGSTNFKKLSRSSLISILRDAIRKNNFGISGRLPKDVIATGAIDPSPILTKIQFDLSQVTNYLNEQTADYGSKHCGRKCRRKRRRHQERSRATQRRTTSHRSDLLKSNKSPMVITKASHVKQDWCRTEPLKQRIKEPGCRPKNVLNSFCYGQCNSFYIPKASVGRNVSASAFQSCAFCKPQKTSWMTVRLHCPGLIPPFRRKRILKVQKCRCLSEILR